MPNIHYFQRYAQPENVVTNNTLLLLGRIYSYSPSRASQLLTDLTGESIEIGIEINQQIRESKSVPDGHVIQRSFKILVESKVNSPPYLDQLIRHSESFSDEHQKILLLLTNQPLGEAEEDKIRRQIRDHRPGVTFKSISYEEVCKAIEGLFREHEDEMRDLVDDYKSYCNDMGLFDRSKNLMRMVPCGESWELNRKYGIYFYPSDRGYTDHEFVGIYANKAVHAIWKIDSIFDIEYKDGKLKKTLIKGRPTDEYDEKLVQIIKDAETECDYYIKSGHRFFCGKPEDTKYEKETPGGMLGGTFVDLREHIDDFDNLDVKSIAQKLRKMTW